MRLNTRHITPAIKHIKCHAGPRIESGAGFDPASSSILDSRFRGNDGFDIYCCRSNTPGFTLIEIIITLTVTAVLATMIYMYFGKAFSESVTPITRLRNSATLQRVMENIRADYNVYPKWRSGAVYTTSNYVIPTNFNGHRYLCTTAGTSSATEPNWPLNSGGTVTESGGVIWTETPPSPWTSAFLTTLKNNIGAEGSDQPANPYGKNPDGTTYTKYNVVRNRFTQFVNDIDQDSDASGANKILKVTLKNDNGETLTALFFSY
jgi:prepilin-type N-terminal cleavage/methylation domain-containing protein